MNLQSQSIYVHKKTISNNIYLIHVEDNASGEQVGDNENIIVENLFKI